VELQKTEGEVQRVFFFRMRIRMVSHLWSPYGVPFLHLCALLLQIHGPA
jgi:hypothetical protein